MRHGLAESTRRSYSVGQRRFIAFCQQLGNLDAAGSPLPASEWTLCLFATELAKSINASSIKVYLSAVRALHIEQGFQDPLINYPRLQRVLRGIKRTQGCTRAERLPVTNSIMSIIKNSLDLQCYDHCMFWAACTLAYFGFLRSAEFTVPSLAAFSSEVHLQVNDIEIDSMVSPSCIRVHLKASKTDPFRRGCFIHIGRGTPQLCAIEAMLVYLNMRGNGPGPLFLLQSGLPLSRSLLTDWIRKIVHAAGVHGNFASHSFRIGAATVAARNGVPDHLIQTLGRWSSNAYQLYIRTPTDVLAKAAKDLA